MPERRHFSSLSLGRSVTLLIRSVLQVALAAAIGSAWPSPVRAQKGMQWVLVYGDDDVALSVEPATAVHRPDSTWLVLVNWEYSSLQPATNNLPKRKSTRTHYILDCAGKRFKALDVHVYDADGNDVHGLPPRSDSTAGWTLPIPGTLDGALVRGFCANRFVISGDYARALAAAQDSERVILAREQAICDSPPAEVVKACATVVGPGVPTNDPKVREAQRMAFDEALAAVDRVIGAPLPKPPSWCREPYVMIQLPNAAYCW
jgi:hypothetical protein